MEIKKTTRADIEQSRTTSFLLGLIVVLSALFVALEWNSSGTETELDTIDLGELIRENELIPMSNEEKLVEMKQQPESVTPQKLRVVDDMQELQVEEPVEQQTDEGDGTLMPEDDDGKTEALAPMGVDMDNNPLNFHVVEDLPQFPGGAVELMKFLTRNLHYPETAQKRRIQGTVQTQFYIEKDGSVTGIAVTRSLSPECDNEALRVLRMMPRWKPGVQNDRPCRTKVSVPIVFQL